MIEIIVTVLSLVVFIGAVWYGICNERAFKQRRSEFPSVDDPDFWSKSSAFKSVPYRDHVWALFFFRDPNELYK